MGSGTTPAKVLRCGSCYQLETSNNRAIWMKEPGIRLWCGRLVTAIGMPTRGRLG